MKGAGPGISRPFSNETSTHGIIEQIPKRCRNVLISSDQMIVEAPLPNSSGDIFSQSLRYSSFEESHEVEQGTFHVEHKDVDMIRHHTEAEDVPGFAVKTAELVDDVVGVVRIRKQ